MYDRLVPWIVRQQFYSTALTKTVPVVTIPLYVRQHVERQKKREKLKLLQVAKVKPRGGNKAFPLITAQKADFDFYLGQWYPKNFRIPLVSDHWMKKNTSGQKFTIHKQSENPSLPMVYDRVGLDTKCEFSQFGLKEDVVLALKNEGMCYPTPPQSQAIPEIMDNTQNVLFVAESGSGKTIGYLTPVVNSIMDLKQKLRCEPNSPLAIVVVPGKELAEQIAQQAFHVCDPCGIDVRVVVSDGTQHKHLVHHDNENVDVLVGTFGTMKFLFKRKIFSMKNIHHVVLDEADTLLDDSFSFELLQFLQYVMACNDEVNSDLMTPKVQLVLASSTWPSDFDSIIGDLIPVDKVKKVVSPHAHRLMPHITHKFIRARDSVRSGVLLELVKDDVRKNVPVMIFANQSPACDWLSHFLEANDIPNAKFHAGMHPEKRMKSFNKFKDGHVDVLCCTDLASRGLDMQWVRHVINFDFPHNMSDYIHRSGRIGRVGSNHGYITNLVNTVPGALVVQQVEMAVRKSTGLPSINANIKRKIEKLKYMSQYGM